MAQSNPQGTDRWYADFNRRVNPVIDGIDIPLLVILLLVLALAGYGVIAGASYWDTAVSWFDHVPLPPLWVWYVALFGSIIAMFAGPLFSPSWRGPTIPRDASQEDPDRYWTTATRGWRSFIAISTPTDWLIMGAALSTVVLVMCSNYDDGEWTMLWMRIRLLPYTSDTREIFHTTSSIFGWILGIVGGIVTATLCLGGFESWWNTPSHRAAIKQRVVTGAKVGAAIGAYQELRKSPEERRTAAGTMRGAATGAAIGVAANEAEALFPVLFAFGLAAGVGYLCYLVGYYAIGAPVGAVVFVVVMAWKVAVAAWMLFVTFMLSLLALTVLRMCWRTPIEVARCIIDASRPFPRSRTRWTGTEDWVLVEKAPAGAWTSIWQQ